MYSVRNIHDPFANIYKSTNLAREKITLVTLGIHPPLCCKITFVVTIVRRDSQTVAAIVFELRVRVTPRASLQKQFTGNSRNELKFTNRLREHFKFFF